MLHNKYGHTMYRMLIWSVVAHSFTCPVAPVTALDPTCTHKIPAMRPRASVHIHHRILVLCETCWRLGVRRWHGAKAREGERRVVGRMLALAAHGRG